MVVITLYLHLGFHRFLFSMEESSEYLKGSLILLTEILKVSFQANKLGRRIVKQ